MNTVRKFGTAILAAVMAVCCGCQNIDGNFGAEASSIEKSSSSTEAAFTVPQSISASDFAAEITYYGSRDISGAADLYAKNSGGSVRIIEPGSDYLGTLSEMILSDRSPDLCDKLDNTFPYLMSKNLYEDLTNYIDITSPQWAGYADVIEQYSFKGARYFYPTDIKVMPQFLIYVKPNFIQGGSFRDPEMQWLKDEWDWAELETSAMCVLNSGTTNADLMIYGKNVYDNFLAASGKKVFDHADGRFSCNLFGENSMRIYHFLTTYGSEVENDFDANNTVSRTVFLSGDEKDLAALRKSGLTVGAVPYPRCSDDAYYSKAVSEGFLVPKGAVNIQSAASFINCSRLSSASDEAIEKRNKELISSGLLRSDVEWLNSLRSSDKMTPILIDVNCLDDETNSAVQKILSLEERLTWEEMVEQNFPISEAGLEKINKITE